MDKFKFCYLQSPYFDSRNQKGVRCLLTKTIIATFVVCSIMSTSSAFPAPYLIAKNPPNHHPVLSSMFINPCGGIMESSAGVRTGWQDALETLERALKMTMSNFRHLNTTRMVDIYKSTMNLTKQFINHGLPVKQFQEFTDFKHGHLHLGNNKIVQHELAKLYENLLRYGVAFDKLSRMIPTTENSDHIEVHRNVVLNQLKTNHKNLLCEVEMSVNDTSATIKTDIAQNASQIGKDWPKNPDLTALLTTDMGVYVHYKSFLEEWIKITRDVHNLPKKDIQKRNSKKRQKKSKMNKKRNVKARQAKKRQRSAALRKKTGVV